MSKYGNKRTMYGGMVFDSKAERDRYIVLLSRERKGEISNLRCQPRFKIISKQAKRLASKSYRATRALHGGF